MERKLLELFFVRFVTEGSCQRLCIRTFPVAVAGVAWGRRRRQAAIVLIVVVLLLAKKSRHERLRIGFELPLPLVLPGSSTAALLSGPAAKRREVLDHPKQVARARLLDRRVAARAPRRALDVARHRARARALSLLRVPRPP